MPKGSRKTQSGNAVVKYCSDRCRHRKPGPIDRKIEDAFLALLEGKEANAENSEEDAPTVANKPRRRVAKDDGRILVECGTVEELVFGSRYDPERVYGRRKNRAPRALITDDCERKSVDMEDTDGSLEDRDDEPGGVQIDSQRNTVGPMIRPPQMASDVNGSIGGEKGWAERKEETAEELEKRKAGQRRAEEREMVRRAARRACAFGLYVVGTLEPAREDIPKGKGQKGQTSRAQQPAWCFRAEEEMRGCNERRCSGGKLREGRLGHSMERVS